MPTNIQPNARGSYLQQTWPIAPPAAPPIAPPSPESQVRRIRPDQTRFREAAQQTPGPRRWPRPRCRRSLLRPSSLGLAGAEEQQLDDQPASQSRPTAAQCTVINEASERHKSQHYSVNSGPSRQPGRRVRYFDFIATFPCATLTLHHFPVTRNSKLRSGALNARNDRATSALDESPGPYDCAGIRHAAAPCRDRPAPDR